MALYFILASPNGVMIFYASSGRSHNIHGADPADGARNWKWSVGATERGCYGTLPVMSLARCATVLRNCTYNLNTLMLWALLIGGGVSFSCMVVAFDNAVLRPRPIVLFPPQPYMGPPQHSTCTTS